MPTHEEAVRFLREWARLSVGEQTLFLAAVDDLVEDLRAKAPIRPSLRVKRVQGHAGIYELTWAADGRATFEYGPAAIPGEVHIIWRRIGAHDILKEP